MSNQDIISAAKTLAGVCDGAQAQDGTGYNGRDAPFIHSILKQDFDPTPKQVAAIYKLLRTYTRQLSGFGIEYSDLTCDPIRQEKTVSTETHKIDPTWTKTIGFGKHKGKTYSELYQEAPDYIEWIIKNFDDGEIKDDMRLILAGKPLDNEKITLDFVDEEIKITSPFAAKDLCSDLSIRKWDGKNWTCPGMIIEEVFDTFTSSTFEIEITKAFENERKNVETLKTMSNATESDFTISDEFGGEKTLYPYQLAGAKFLEMSNGSAMINDGVGLGKSAQALSQVFSHPEHRPVIIVCPSSVKYQWQEYCREWVPGCNPTVITPTKADMTGDIVILNYDILKKNLSKLKKLNAKILILDESHKVKNYKSQRTIAAVDLATRIPHRILLSGTPALNRTSELWMQLQILRPDIYNRMYFTAWHKKYCAAKKTQYGWDYSGNSNTVDLANELKHLMIRRTEEEVFDELPEMIRTTVPIDITNRKEYNTAAKNYIAWVKEQRGLSAARKAKRAEHLSRIAVLKRLVAEGKMKSAISWIKDYLETEEKIVIFAHHKTIISALKEEFGNECVVIDGSTKQEDRIPITERFEHDPTVKIFIGNIKAASEGLNLGVSKTVVTLEFDWSPKTHEQAEGRIKGLRQIGRGRTTTQSYYLVGLDTIDIEIIAMLEAKRKVIDTAMDDDNVNLDFDFLAGLVK